MHWYDKLTKKDIAHLKENRIFAKKKFLFTIKYQSDQRKRCKNKIIPCGECWDIAHKLGVWPK